ncbi:MAG: hypothetical protein P9M01_03730 [Candidatus Kappaea frigidicola]|nr:hypothetical protein [Candidatus Kappaea frigidicola]
MNKANFPIHVKYNYRYNLITLIKKYLYFGSLSLAIVLVYVCWLCVLRRVSEVITLEDAAIVAIFIVFSTYSIKLSSGYLKQIKEHKKITELDQKLIILKDNLYLLMRLLLFILFLVFFFEYDVVIVVIAIPFFAFYMYKVSCISKKIKKLKNAKY